MDTTDFMAFLRARLSEDEAGVASFFGHDFGPSRPSREIDFKRAILAEHPESDGGYCEICYYGYGGGSWPCPTVRALAAVYRDHPDYDLAWAGDG